MSKRRGNFYNHLGKYRRRIGYSQKDVSQILGFSDQSQVCRWEKGIKLPGVLNLLKLSALYRVPITFLFIDWFRQIKEEVMALEEEWRQASGYYQKMKNKTTSWSEFNS